jgi:hypothetical protein
MRGGKKRGFATEAQRHRRRPGTREGNKKEGKKLGMRKERKGFNAEKDGRRRRRRRESG